MNEDIIDYGHGVSEMYISSSVSALINEIDEGAQVFDDTSAAPVPLPGDKGKKYRGYVPWGADNDLPTKILRKIRKDEVMSQNKLFNTLTCYGSGLRLRDDAGKKITDKEQVDFFKYNRMPRYMLEQITDMKHFFFSVAVVILSRDGKKIVKLRHKDVIYCRFETCHPKTGKIEHLYSANWADNPDEKAIEIIPILDMNDPLGELEYLMGKKPGPDGLAFERTKDRKFAIVNSFPIPGSKYYPFAYYWSVFLSGWYDLKRLIPKGKKAKFKNHASIKYHVEIHRDYWENLCREERITEPEKKQERIKKEKENIKEFLTGIENSGKLWISGFYMDPQGREVKMVRVNIIDNAKEGGDWLEDVGEAMKIISYADNVHPSLIGATPGKDGGFSGSVQRELFTMKQSLEKSYQDLLLESLFVVKEYNGWDNLIYDIPVITLTTLDKGKDAEENTLRGEGE